MAYTSILMLSIACDLVIVCRDCRCGRSIQILRIGRFSACVVTICGGVLSRLMIVRHIVRLPILVAAVEHVRPVNTLASILVVVVVVGFATSYGIADAGGRVDTVVDIRPRGGSLVHETV